MTLAGLGDCEVEKVGLTMRRPPAGRIVTLPSPDSLSLSLSLFPSLALIFRCDSLFIATAVPDRTSQLTRQ